MLHLRSKWQFAIRRTQNAVGVGESKHTQLYNRQFVTQRARARLNFIPNWTYFEIYLYICKLKENAYD